jgi:hypothetical protein
MNRRWIDRIGCVALLANLAHCLELDDRVVTGVGVGANQPFVPQSASDAGLPGVEAGEPHLVLDTAELDLGPIVLGAPARRRVLVSNTGTAAMPAPSVRWADGSSTDLTLVQNLCESSIAVGASCDLRVQLVPSQAGAVSGTLVVASSPGGNAQLSVEALGVAGGDLVLAAVAGGSTDLGGVVLQASREGIFNLTNPLDVATGPLSISVNNPEFSLPSAAPGECVPGLTSLVSGEGCNIRVGFSPARRGPSEATLTVISEGVGATSLALSAQGLAPGLLSVSTEDVDFKGVAIGLSAQDQVTLKNDGDQPLTLAGVSLVDDATGDFAIASSDCGAAAVLPAGGVCIVTVEFRPKAVASGSSATLQIATAEGATSSVPLHGEGLEPGSIVVAPAAGALDDFGGVLLGEAREQAFEVTNPGTQPSGPLTLTASSDFSILTTAPVAGECLAGQTSLVNGESCSVRVSFAPTQRGVLTGLLTIGSSLAGGTSRPLTGTGVTPATLEVSVEELNFGRIVTGSSAPGSVTIKNTGDQELPPPSANLVNPAGGAVEGFTLANGCTAALALDQTCEIGITFAPVRAVAHAATLRVESTPGGSVTTLLVGEAFPPGALVAAVAAGNATDFGDVAIGESRLQSFTLTNPGGVPSGRITITTNINTFSVDPGDCNAVAGGLVDGGTCTFKVKFEPNTSEPANASISVTSPGAGNTALAVSGRGRVPAALNGSNVFNFGTVNIGQVGGPRPWTVSNPGDLATGPMTVQVTNPEFEITQDTCSATSLGGRLSCSMNVSFRPRAAGARTGSVSVSSGALTAAVLTLQGDGHQLSALGQGCTADGDCSNGVCTKGANATRVCCQAACGGTCQFCNAQGACETQGQNVACGNGGVCFGVNACLLPNGGGCSANGGGAECGNGNCETAANGLGLVCCGQDCGGSQRCSADFAGCALPAAGQGQVCAQGGQTVAACGGGFTCNAATGTCCPSGCTGPCQRCAANGQCEDLTGQQGGCTPGQICLNAAGCGTPTVGVGSPCTRGTDCDTGNCAALRNGGSVCCEAGCTSPTGECGRDGSCLSPLGAQCSTGASCGSGQCVNRPVNGGAPVCCADPCSATGLCSADGQRCIECDRDGEVFNGIFQCPNGCNEATERCNPLATDGTDCSGANTSCNSGVCQNASDGVRRCCASDCASIGQVCGITGASCQCPSDRTRDPGTGLCKALENGDCTVDSDCAGGAPCTLRGADNDQDGFAQSGSRTFRACGSVPRGNEAIIDPNDARRDCCDFDATTFPGAPGAVTADACGSFDRNCENGVEITGRADVADCNDLPLTAADCNIVRWTSGVAPACGESGQFEACGTSVQGNPVSICSGITGGQLVNTCR